MLLLTSPTEVLRLVTASAVTVDVHASYVDQQGTVVTPGVTDTAITTATTTNIVPSPTGDQTKRNIRTATIRNKHASSSNAVTVQRYDGTTAVELTSCVLLANEELALGEDGRWRHMDSAGAEYSYGGPPAANLGITGTLAETMPRETCPEVNTTVAASGTLFLQAVYLKAGQLVSNISFYSATTAANTPTNYFFALYSEARALLAQSANQTSSAWAANTIKTVAMTTPYRVPTSGVYYLAFMMTATTVPTLKGGTAKTGGQLAATAPILHGTSTTGLTTSLPNPAAAITGGTASIWGAVT